MEPAIFLTQTDLEKILEATVMKVLSLQKKEPQTMTDDILTIQQASELLGLKISTIYGYVRDKNIPHSKVRKRLYFSKQEINKWCNSHRVKTLSELSDDAEVFLKRKT